MIHKTKDPAQGAAAGSKNIDPLAALDTQETNQTPFAAQEGISRLQREFTEEALRIAGLKANHAADNLAIGDDLCAERDIAIAIAHLQEAASTFRTMQRQLKPSAEATHVGQRP